MPRDTTRAGGPVWFGGGKLAADLTLPKLRCRWQATSARPGDRFTAAERAAIWEYAARTAAGAAEEIRNLTATDPAVAADAAWAAADTLHAAAAALGSRILRQAADSYDRAARAPYGRIPAPGQPGNNLRHTARFLSTYTSVVLDAPLAEMTLLMRFARLAEAIAELREAQRLAAQAAAARRAAEHLWAAMPGYVTRHRAGAPGSALPQLSAAGLSSLSQLAPSGPEPARRAKQTVSGEPGQFPAKVHRAHGARRGNWSGRLSRGRGLGPSRQR